VSRERGVHAWRYGVALLAAPLQQQSTAQADTCARTNGLLGMARRPRNDQPGSWHHAINRWQLHGAIRRLWTAHRRLVDSDPEYSRRTAEVGLAAMTCSLGRRPNREPVRSGRAQRGGCTVLGCCERSAGRVAVGTPVAQGPPRRSQRAELPHWAPTSGDGVKALARPGMQDSWIGQPSANEALHARPGVSALLASTPQRRVPQAGQTFTEVRHGRAVPRHSVVLVVSA
jgi:hypothetical protein